MDGFREIRSDWETSALRGLAGKRTSASRSRSWRNHGTRARVPGVLFRAMAALYLSERRDVPRDTLAGILARRLAAEGIEYHARTIRRQILGSVDSVPPEVEACLADLCVEDVFGGDRDALTRALGDLGVLLSDSDARAPYVPVSRLDRMVRLWLFFNRGQSKRSLAEELHRDLEAQGVRLTRESIQWKLALNGHLVRREVLEQLVGYLALQGLESEEAALAFLGEHGDTVDGALDGRALVDAEAFRRNCRLWQVVNREASTRRLAALLRTQMADRGVRLGIEHIQRSIAGKTPRVRQDLATAMDELLFAALPKGETVETLAARTEWTESRGLDLAWVKCEPIAELAREWIRQHPGTSMRQLAIRVVRTIRRMGYQSSHNTIQPILGGWKKRTRGYVFRALLKQFSDRRDESIPAEYLVARTTNPSLGRESSACESLGRESLGRESSGLESSRRATRSPARRSDPSDLRRPVRSIRRADGSTGDRGHDSKGSLDAFIDEATRHLSHAKSPLFAKLAALRAEKLFGVAAEDAYATILERAAS